MKPSRVSTVERRSVNEHSVEQVSSGGGAGPAFLKARGGESQDQRFREGEEAVAVTVGGAKRRRKGDAGGATRER